MLSVHGKRHGLQALCLCGLLLAVAATSAMLATAAEEKDAAPKFDPTEAPTVKWMLKARPVEDADAKTEAEMKPYTEEIPATDVKFDMVPDSRRQVHDGQPRGRGRTARTTKARSTKSRSSRSGWASAR